MRTVTAEEVASTFIREWVSRFGVPSVITTDRGTQFESDLFRRLMHNFATKRIRTTAYHPSANGMIERVHRQLKGSLMCHGTSWTQALPLVLLGMRSAYKEDIKATAAEMLYGEALRLPGELLVSVPNPNYEDAADLVSTLRTHMSELRPTPASRHTNIKPFIFKDLATATHIFLRDDTVRRPLQPPYTGPYPILQRSADGKTLTINCKGRTVVVSVDRVKPAFVDSSGSTSTDSHEATKPPPKAPCPPTIPVPVQQPVVTTRSGRRVKFKTFD